MKSKEKAFLARSVVVFGVVTSLFIVGGIFLWEYLNHNIEALLLWISFCFVLDYLMVSYLLSPIFQTNRFLDVLLKDTLHELNIPLSVIKANLHMLQANEQDEKKQKRLERIALASRDLYALYKEVDYYIKKEIEAEVQEYFYLDEAIASVVEKYDEIANGTMIECELLHVELWGDRHGFEKVISNLLSNAIKYNQEKKTIKILQHTNSVIVKDEGIGISEAELFLIFDRYYQADTSKEGYGIGLSLVKAYCDRSKIALSIHSQKNKGTEVILDLSNLLSKR